MKDKLKMENLEMDWEKMEEEAIKYFPGDEAGQLRFEVDWLKQSLKNLTY